MLLSRKYFRYFFVVFLLPRSHYNATFSQLQENSQIFRFVFKKIHNFWHINHQKYIVSKLSFVKKLYFSMILSIIFAFIRYLSYKWYHSLSVKKVSISAKKPRFFKNTFKKTWFLFYFALNLSYNRLIRWKAAPHRSGEASCFHPPAAPIGRQAPATPSLLWIHGRDRRMPVFYYPPAMPLRARFPP